MHCEPGGAPPGRAPHTGSPPRTQPHVSARPRPPRSPQTPTASRLPGPRLPADDHSPAAAPEARACAPHHSAPPAPVSRELHTRGPGGRPACPGLAPELPRPERALLTRARVPEAPPKSLLQSPAKPPTAAASRLALSAARGRGAAAAAQAFARAGPAPAPGPRPTRAAEPRFVTPTSGRSGLDARLSIERPLWWRGEV